MNANLMSAIFIGLQKQSNIALSLGPSLRATSAVAPSPSQSADSSHLYT